MLLPDLDEERIDSSSGNPFFPTTHKAKVMYLHPVGSYIPLHEIAVDPQLDQECFNGTVLIHNRILDREERATFLSLPASQQQRIPRIIHQTSKSRCVAPLFAEGAQTWQDTFWGYDYYFHDDAAMDELVRRVSRSHPLLGSLEPIWNSCVVQGAMKADLWRSVVLWEYGGIYSDLDSWPNHLTPDELNSGELPPDAVFFPDFDKTLSYHFIATRPRHPLMFLLLQVQLHNVFWVKDTQRIDPVINTGPYALRTAVTNWMRLGGVEVIPNRAVQLAKYGQNLGNDVYVQGGGEVQSGIYQHGGYNIVVLPFEEDRDYWVLREAGVSNSEKIELYATMNMTYFGDDMQKDSHKSCVGALKTMITGP